MPKNNWFICIFCAEKFLNGDEKHHRVTTPDGQKCMGQTQLALTFKRDAQSKAWSLK